MPPTTSNMASLTDGGLVMMWQENDQLVNTLVHKVIDPDRECNYAKRNNEHIFSFFFLCVLNYVQQISFYFNLSIYLR